MVPTQGPPGTAERGVFPASDGSPLPGLACAAPTTGPNPPGQISAPKHKQKGPDPHGVPEDRFEQQDPTRDSSVGDGRELNEEGLQLSSIARCPPLTAYSDPELRHTKRHSHESTR